MNRFTSATRWAAHRAGLCSLALVLSVPATSLGQAPAATAPVTAPAAAAAPATAPAAPTGLRPVQPAGAIPPPGGGAAPAGAAAPGGPGGPGGTFRQAPARLRPSTNAVPVNPAGGVPPPAAGALPRGGAPGAGAGAGAGGAGAPGAPGTAAAPEGEPNLTAEEVRNLPDDDLVTLFLPNTPLETALDLYSGLVRRVLLRGPQIPGGPINLKFEDLTRAEAIEAMNAVLALNGVSVIPVGEKFIKVVPSQEVAAQGAKASDEDPDAMSELGQFVTKVIKVKQVAPGDIAQAVQAFASGKVQNPVLVFDDQSFFILRDMAPNVKRMSELIKELDVALEHDYKLEVIPIRYGKVDEIYETLNSVVTGSGGGGGSGSSRMSGFTSGGGAGGVGGVGGGLNSQTGGSGSYNSRSSRSGSRSGSRSRSSNFGVNSGGAAGGMTSPGAARTGLQDRLRQVTASAVGGGGGGGGQYNLVSDARIIPDNRSNSLLVYANKEDFKMLTNIVAKIDTLLAQVLIESIILEVSLDKNKDFGVSMAQNPKKFGNWTGAAGSVNDASIATNLVASAFPSGFSYFGQYKDDFAVAVTAMATDSRARVLARPRIQTTHAQQASFRIGDTVPYPRSSQPFYGGIGGASTPYTTYDERDVLTELNVIPYITPDGLVTLEVEQTIDQLGPTTKVGQDEVPTIRTRSASAVLSVKDREPVILGGFITDRQTDSTSGVPWLKDIPLLGWAFRSKSDFKQRSELIVLIRPTILNTPTEASKMAELERRSLPNAAAAVREFQQDEAAMAKRLGVVPGDTNEVPAEASAPSNKKSSKKKRE